MRVKLVRYTARYLQHSWDWLKDDEIRFLTDSSNFTMEEQTTWYKNLKRKRNYIIWGVEYDSKPIGACGLKNICETDCEYWGYIGEKQYWGQGLGTEMMFLVEERVRQLGKGSIFLKVIHENQRAISLYKKQGFITESETENIIVMRKFL